MSLIRPSWDEYFMLIAKLVSTRSTCNSRPVGAVLVKDKQILATGYNGSVPGAAHCSEFQKDYCFRRMNHIPEHQKYGFCRASHAEANAVAQAARHGISIAGSSLYVTLEPCYTCIKLLATARVRRVLFELRYDTNRTMMIEELINEAGFAEYRQLIIPAETSQAVAVKLYHTTFTLP